MELIEGKVWKFGDNIDTDVIIPGRFLRTFDPKELASHVMAGERPDFASIVGDGDIIVGGWNFGCGSSREQAPVSIKYSGVSAVIAKSFARIFYRNAINIGLPVIVADIESDEGDILNINLEKGIISNLTNNQTFSIAPFKEFMLNILNEKGLVNHYLREKE
ncbi:homoaconitase small subunit [Methanobrevibacter filiformis]|uniref:3-isopropylmalate dehydratase small subunit n=1 Tax=Methanobrevibacter filiformis TaxID=55758 RepID=A0A166CJW7_9EURY|nr:homoaconitase small subunit [Methanobrevibacter filiformis]KZX14588.1 2,3-dimethylmalate dehydratase small subunit [Methanobrevibacter filiformis]